MPFSSIFLLNTVSILPCVNEYSNIKASKMNATKILKDKVTKNQIHERKAMSPAR